MHNQSAPQYPPFVYLTLLQLSDGNRFERVCIFVADLEAEMQSTAERLIETAK